MTPFGKFLLLKLFSAEVIPGQQIKDLAIKIKFSEL